MSKLFTYQFNDLSKAQQDCLTLIESLGIYELRALARVFGGKSPTTLKRNDHIKIIMDKIISGEDLKPIPLRQGRPYKELSSIEGILAELSQITGKDYTFKSNQTRTASHLPKMVTFRQVEEDLVKQKLFPIQIRGVLCQKNDKEYFLTNLDNGKNVLIKKDFDVRLKPYDYIEGTAVVMNEEKEYIIESIKAINFQRADAYIDANLPYDPVIPTQEVEIADQNLTLGTRYMLNQSKLIDDTDKLKKMLADFRKNNIVTLALVPNVFYEDFLTYNTLGFFNMFLLRYEERPFVINETINIFIEHVKRLQQQGLSIAIFIEDINTLANAVDYSFKNNTKALMGHTESTVETIKNLMLLAKAGAKNKSTTIITTSDVSDMSDQLFVSSVYKISKKLN